MDYNFLYNTASSGKWQKIGINRRAGIAIPLFSIFSKNSIGIGEITDIKLLIDWCKLTGMSIIQLLPLNEIGEDNAPYNSISTFAIEPIYININALKGINLNLFQDDIIKLKKRFPQRKLRARYNVKQAKIDLLWKIFKDSFNPNDPDLMSFIQQNKYWLDDYTLFKVISEKTYISKWEKWPVALKNYEHNAILEFQGDNKERINFYKWVQWQLFEQLKSIKQYAESKEVLLMGDLPFLVSRDGADVWAHQNYFKMELSAGAPPDMYFAMGQKWGMPPYNWYKIAEDGFTYLKEKLQYSENFYHMFRIDHFVGLFRVWTIPLNAPPEEAAFNGNYEPQNESLWEEHGKAILNIMLSSTSMLPCAEDLGTVPACSYKVLYEYGIPGIEFQRYLKNQAANFGFKKPGDYRLNSTAVISTHDSSFFFNWWKSEAGTMDEKLFEMLCQRQGLDKNEVRELKRQLFERKLSKYGRLYWKNEINSREMFLSIVKPNDDTLNSLSYAYMDSYGEKWKFFDYIEKYDTPLETIHNSLICKSLEKINESASIFSIQLLQEYLAMDENLFGKMDRWSYRINTPGTVSGSNWSVLIPCSLEDMLELEINVKIKSLILQTGRAS